MTTTIFDIRAGTVDIGIDLAWNAWAKACRDTGRIVKMPGAVVPLKPQRPGRKSGVYRLEAADCMEGPVIAKRCLRDSAMIERQIYERVLPAIDLSALRFHGFVEDGEQAYCWLFVEDAGTVKLTESDRGLAAQWLARLHTLTAAMADAVSLPERGAGHYHEHLRAGLVNLERAATVAELSAETRATLEDLRRRLDRVYERWDKVCEPCTRFPRSLVHGDFSRKNSRLRATDAGSEIVALDWETAGWGPPAADLTDWSRPSRKMLDGWGGTAELDVYAAAVAGFWPGVTLRDVEQQARVGTIFRVVAAVRWASEDSDAATISARVYKFAALADALAATAV